MPSSWSSTCSMPLLQLFASRLPECSLQTPQQGSHLLIRRNLGVQCSAQKPLGQLEGPVGMRIQLTSWLGDVRWVSRWDNYLKMRGPMRERL